MAYLRIALCYPNTHAIGMANLGLHTMYELFNSIPEVSCERVFLPDPDELKEYERSRTPLLSLETRRRCEISMSLRSRSRSRPIISTWPGCCSFPAFRFGPKDRNHFHPLVIMGGAASFLNPEPIADFTDVIAVGEGEILAYQLDRCDRWKTNHKEEILLVARTHRPRLLCSVALRRDLQRRRTVFDYIPNREGVPRRVGRALGVGES